MKLLQHIILSVCVMACMSAWASEDTIINSETFEGYTTATDYSSNTERLYEGIVTTWTVTNGCVTNTGIKGKKVALQYNAADRAGEMTSLFIPRLDSLKMKLARAAAQTVTAVVYYSRDGENWRVLGSKNGANMATDYYVNWAATLPEPKAGDPDGAYIQVKISATKDASYSYGNSYRVYVDDIVSYQHPEVDDECGNCFTLNL